MKYFLIIIPIILILTSERDGRSLLKVSVYYEALCPASQQFISTQLYPSFKKIGKYLHLELVPFGKAKACNDSGHWEFTCQHGPKECYANKVQSCALSKTSLSAVEGLTFVKCGMSSHDPSSDKCLEKCANNSNVSWDFIKNCLLSGEADELLAINGKKTHSVKPKIKYVPTIIFNDNFDEDLDQNAAQHFLKTVCKLLNYSPIVCNTDTFYHATNI